MTNDTRFIRTKAVCFGTKTWNRIENGEISTYSYSQTSNVRQRCQTCIRESQHLQPGWWESWIFILKNETKAISPILRKDTCTHTHIMKWIKDLNIRPGTLKLAEENLGKTLHSKVIDKDFLEGPKQNRKWSQELTSRIHQIKSLPYKQRKTPPKWKRQSIGCEKVL